MSSRKPYLVLALAIGLVACGQTKLPAVADVPPGPINHTLQGASKPHIPADCPSWNGAYSSKTGLMKGISTRYDENDSLILTDGSKGWVVNGKPEILGNDPKASYSAYCTGDPKNRTIVADVYKYGTLIYTVTYATNLTADVNGNAFDFSVTYPDGLHRPLETYAGSSAVPAARPAQGQTPNPNPPAQTLPNTQPPAPSSN